MMRQRCKAWFGPCPTFIWERVYGNGYMGTAQQRPSELDGDHLSPVPRWEREDGVKMYMLERTLGSPNAVSYGAFYTDPVM
jgi:hypothetical protein